MKPLSLRTRLFLWFAGLAAPLLVATSVAHYFHTRDTLIETLDRGLLERLRELADEEDQEELGEDAETTTKRVGDFLGFEAYDWPARTLVARSASLRGAPPLDEEDFDSLFGRDETPKLVAGATNASRRPMRVVGYVRRLRLFVAYGDLRQIDHELEGVLSGLGASLSAAVVLAFAAAWPASRHLTKPLRDIAAAADRVESGDAAVVLPKSGAGDEVDRLAATLERAFARLADAYARQARFSADAAHELRTPVAVVLSQAEVALRRERTPDEYREGMTQIAASARRMQETLDALLLLARGDCAGLGVHAGRVDLADVARETVAASAAEARAKSIDLRLDAPGPAAVAGDARLLAMLVRNLLANAVVHGKTGGVAEVSVAADGEEVVLTVRDDGPGISPEALPHVFERFFRADDSRSRATGGSGLGLSIVRLVAEAHGGSAAIESAPGQGTRVIVRLPA